MSKPIDPTPRRIVEILDRLREAMRGALHEEDDDYLRRAALAEIEGDEPDGAERLQMTLVEYVLRGETIPGALDYMLLRIRLRAVQDLIHVIGRGDDGIRLMRVIERELRDEDLPTEELTEDDRVQAARDLVDATLAVASSIFEREHKADSLKSKRQDRGLRNQSRTASNTSAEKRRKTREKWTSDAIRNARAVRSNKKAQGEQWDRERIAKELAPALGKSWRTVYNAIGPAFKKA